VGIQTHVAEKDLPVSERVTLSANDLVQELRRVLRLGLPANQRNVGDRLPHLRNVVARATHPDDLLSRIDSLNALLARIIEEVADERARQAARILFGLAAGSAGTTLTVRRQRCSTLLEYEFDHFRKRVEQRILFTIGEGLHRDLVNYRSRVRRATDAFEIGRPTPTLGKDEINREDEHLSRIWQRLYEVRAETIATHLAGNLADAELHRGAAQLAAKELHALARDYVDAFGRQFISQGELEYAIDGIERLVIWRVGS